MKSAYVSSTSRNTNHGGGTNNKPPSPPSNEYTYLELELESAEMNEIEKLMEGKFDEHILQKLFTRLSNFIRDLQSRQERHGLLALAPALLFPPASSGRRSLA
jgi:hypothetical protein